MAAASGGVVCREVGNTDFVGLCREVGNTVFVGLCREVKYTDLVGLYREVKYTFFVGCSFKRSTPIDMPRRLWRLVLSARGGKIHSICQSPPRMINPHW